MNNRRMFLKRGAAAIAAASITPSLSFAAEVPVSARKQLKDDPFKLGMAGYTFVNFDLDKTLDTMDRLDVRYLCIKDFHLPFASTDDQIKAFQEKLAARNITGYAVGPIYMRSEKEIDNAFEYAKRVGVKLIVGVPNVELLPYVDKKVKEYDMNYAIHLHGPDIKLFPNATDVWNHTKDLDPRIGMCLDVGHNLRDGYDPVADLKRYKSRVFDVHIKDVTAASKEGVGIELGRGLIDFPGLIKMLRSVNYTGVCSLEYEKDMKDPFLGIAESIGYFKAVQNIV
ncbi:MAG: sugar phosphate isomerase/epimerase family protein [Tannerellaceae bacterium]